MKKTSLMTVMAIMMMVTFCGCEDEQQVKTGFLSDYSNLQVAECEITAAEIAVGDSYVITGPTTGALEGKITTIRDDGEPVKKTSSKCKATFPVPAKVRLNDKLYILKKI